MDFTKCALTVEMLEQYRDAEGFIDLDKLNIDIDETSRNQVGTADIFKYWVDFAGTKVLLKEEKQLDGERNFSIYSELIMSEIANQLGVKAAKCDLIKFRGKVGIMSYLAMEYEKETLEMTDAMIGETTSFSDAPDISDYVEVEQKIVQVLRKDFGLPKDEVVRIIKDRRKQKILQLFACEDDNHTQNEGFLLSRKEDGKIAVTVAPMFDNERSFSLHYPEADLQQDNDMNEDDNHLTSVLRKLYMQIRGDSNIDIKFSKSEVQEILLELKKMQLPDVESFFRGNPTLRNRIRGNGKLVYWKDKEEYDYELMLDKTLAYIIETDDDAYEMTDFCTQIIDELKPEQIISSIEQKIKAELPVTVKRTFTNLVQMRKTDFDNVINYKELELKIARAAEILKSASDIVLAKEETQEFNTGTDERFE